MFLQGPVNSFFLTICNEQGSLDIYIRYLGNDILINPSSLKNISYCMGKSMPFYDRRIEYLINPGSLVKKEIVKRYTISNVITDDEVKMGEYKLSFLSNKVFIEDDNDYITIYKRQVNFPFTPHLKRPPKKETIIRPVSSDAVESLLINSPSGQHIIPNGESYKTNITRL